MNTTIKKYNFSKLSILIIDDNTYMRSLLKNILLAFKVRDVKEAEDGADALKAMRLFRPDIVICDWNMAPLNGLDFVRLVRQGSDSIDPFVPIIMVTGNSDASHVIDARDAGVTEFLMKPLSAESLYIRMVSAIEQERDFIKSPSYTGPDRRRRLDKEKALHKRRKMDMEIESDTQDVAPSDEGSTTTQ